jgi:BCD family chlorophyll transporter-like MFS transporter
MISLPVLIAPFRALLGFRSDTYKSAIGWKRVPYIWFGSLWQFGGLAVMPFALLVLAGDVVHEVPFAGEVLAALAFLMTGLGLHMTQTAGLALASDRATEETRPRVVALLYVMFLVGMAISAIIIGYFLIDFSALRLIRVVQSAALATLILNLIALWKQEHVNPMTREQRAQPRPRFADAWRDYQSGGSAGRLLACIFFGTMAFNMQDVLLEPYGGEILGLSVSSTTMLTALWASGALAGFLLAAKRLNGGSNAYRLAGAGIVVGIWAFTLVIIAAPLQSTTLFCAGAVAIGLGGGLFAVSTLTAAMALPAGTTSGQGLALGAWGAAQATAAGLAIALGGGLRDWIGGLAQSGAWGEALNSHITGYSFVYHTEIGLLFATLVILGPLVRVSAPLTASKGGKPIGLAEFPA